MQRPPVKRVEAYEVFIRRYGTGCIVGLGDRTQCMDNRGKRDVNNYTTPGTGGIPPQEIGAEGGNIGLLDGSTSWKNIEDMTVYRGSRKQMNGCFTMW